MLAEFFIYVKPYGEPLPVFKNPDPKELREITKPYPEPDEPLFRAYLTRKDCYAWDATAATHADVVLGLKKAGMRGGIGVLISLPKEENATDIELYWEPEIRAMNPDKLDRFLRNHPYIKKNLPPVRFTESM
jgi:hypothetical protein